MNPKPTPPEGPFESMPFPPSHPDRMATIATLFGLEPPSLQRSRILELGCAPGGNLLPLACTMPDCHFIGVEPSQWQAEQGQANIRELGLTNVEIRHANFLDIDSSWGKFDYIIAHALFSRVPHDVQDKILAVCAGNLAPKGIAYVSYNTYPGWHTHGILRDMMQVHANRFEQAARFDQPARQVAAARALLGFLDSWQPDEKDLHGQSLKKAAEPLRTRSDMQLYRDYLEEINEPLYFHQFAARADAKGLQFLGEADLGGMSLEGFSREMQQKIHEAAPGVLLQEQYTDFLRNRVFRQTLLVHKDIQVKRNLSLGALMGFHLAAPVVPVKPPVDVPSREPAEFRDPRGLVITASAPLLKAVLLVLGEAWPQALPFSEVYNRAWERLGQTPRRSLAEAVAAGQPDMSELGRFVAQMLTHGILEIHISPPLFTTQVNDQPTASPFARAQARAGRTVTNLRHEMVALGVFDRQLLALLDGTRNRAALEDALSELVRSGALTIRENETAVIDPEKQRQAIAALLNRNLTMLARLALLTA